MTEEKRQEKEEKLKNYLTDDLVQYYKKTYKGDFQTYLNSKMTPEIFLENVNETISRELKMFKESRKLNDVFIDYFEKFLQGNSSTQDTERLKEKIAQAKSLKKESDDLIREKRKSSL